MKGCATLGEYTEMDLAVCLSPTSKKKCGKSWMKLWLSSNSYSRLRANKIKMQAVKTGVDPFYSLSTVQPYFHFHDFLFIKKFYLKQTLLNVGEMLLTF